MKMLTLPRHIDAPKQILIWEFDEIVPILTALCFGVIIEQALLTTVAGIALARMYRKYKDTRPDGYVYHALYWWGFWPSNARTMVMPYRRLFIG
jgi:conjugal transfer pilus assembly protein TraL